MAHAKNESSLADLDKPYEENVIGIKGIAYFAIGLFLLIVVTFGLMYALWGVLEQDAVQTKSSTNPLILSDTERLPPEPRLQGAPGFEVRGPAGRVNLELREPQAEYRELKKIWAEQIKNGQKHPETGMTITMPLDAAIDKMLGQAIKTKSGPEVDKVVMDSKTYFTDSSAGRVRSEKRR